eukprot:12164299-Alexandrium_andersonii.AAC.1
MAAPPLPEEGVGTTTSCQPQRDACCDAVGTACGVKANSARMRMDTASLRARATASSACLRQEMMLVHAT